VSFLSTKRTELDLDAAIATEIEKLIEKQQNQLDEIERKLRISTTTLATLKEPGTAFQYHVQIIDPPYEPGDRTWPTVSAFDTDLAAALAKAERRFQHNSGWKLSTVRDCDYVVNAIINGQLIRIPEDVYKQLLTDSGS